MLKKIFTRSARVFVLLLCAFSLFPVAAYTQDLVTKEHAEVSAFSGTISGTCFNDKNQSGTWDAGETGVVGITLSLKRINFFIFQKEMGTTQTGPDGNYEFSGLRRGSYLVEVTGSGDAECITQNPKKVVLVFANEKFADFGFKLLTLTTTSLPITATTTTTVSSAACDVKNSEGIGDGSFPRWSGATNLITFTQEINNQFEVFTMKPDGTGVTCLTCGKSALSNTRHRGESSWSPNGQYITFTAENMAYPRNGNGTTARPGIGRNHNVWLMTSDGQKFWQLTGYPENWGVMEPFFSHDGTKLSWNEEFQMEEYPDGKAAGEPKWIKGSNGAPYSDPTNLSSPNGHPGCYWGTENLTYRKGEELCSWRVKWAPISFDGNGNPIISGNTLPLAIEASQTLPNVTEINPPNNFTLIESNGFTPDDRGFIGAYCDQSLTPRGVCLSCDIYTWDLSGNNLKRLTWEATYAHEDPYYSPDGKKIAFKCIPGGYAQGKPDEYWLMNADGTSQTNLCGDMQVTHFNTSGYTEYDPNSKQNTEETWCPDGTCLVIGHVSSTETGAGGAGGPHIPSLLYKFSFEGACGNEE